MDWLEYKTKFAQAAIAAGYDQSYIDRCHKYAERLCSADLPIIYSGGHLSSLVGFSEGYLQSVAYRQERFYRDFTIPKKSGAERQISEPLPNLNLYRNGFWKIFFTSSLLVRTQRHSYVEDP